MNKFKTALAAAGLALASSGANAAIVNLSGATVDFSFNENSLNYTIYGDKLVFAASDSVTSPADVSNYAESYLNTPLVLITAKSGYTLDLVSLSETGNYSQMGNTRVDATGSFYLDGYTSTISLDPFDVTTQGLPKEVTTWDANLIGYTANSQTSLAQIYSELYAWTDVTATPGVFNQSNIKLFTMEFEAITAPVPVPGAVWLFGSALTGILVTRRRNIAA